MADQYSDSEDLAKVQNAIRRIVFWLLFTAGMLFTYFVVANRQLPGLNLEGPLLEWLKGPWAIYVAAVVAMTIIGNFFAGMINVLPQWNRAIILRMGKYQSTAGPGSFILPPFFWSIADIVSVRTQTIPFKAEETLTRDNVPVDVEAVLFFNVVTTNPEFAVVNVEDYKAAVFESAQAALRNTISEHTLAEILTERMDIGDHLKTIIDKRTEEWGVNVDSVLIKDIRIPEELQQAMSRQAQAIREGQGRIALGEAEIEASKSFVEAAKLYETNPAAMNLRQMNMLLEMARSGNSLVLMPSSSLNQFDPIALTALSEQTKKQGKPANKLLDQSEDEDSEISATDYRDQSNQRMSSS